jgi:hypothetical protein
MRGARSLGSSEGLDRLGQCFHDTAVRVFPACRLGGGEDGHAIYRGVVHADNGTHNCPGCHQPDIICQHFGLGHDKMKDRAGHELRIQKAFPVGLCLRRDGENGKCSSNTDHDRSSGGNRSHRPARLASLQPDVNRK